RRIDFSQCIFFLTSNALVGDAGPAASEFWERIRAVEEVADEKEKAMQLERAETDLRRLLCALGGIWTAPLMDRHDRTCLFSSLSQDALLSMLHVSIASIRAQSTGPLPPELDDETVHLEILADATGGGAFASARRLERALLQWLQRWANRSDIAKDETRV